ncbi:MAG TPA: undecaprenyl-diphosphate phosphatase, partial [Actinomycetota bacterium]|nr:undecaprenyl-diphosphate phosphatase [Actinomycetota bacterium]
APGRVGPGEAATRRRLLGLLALASVPAAVVGFLLQDWADEQTARPLRASVWLVLTTAIMIAAELYARSRSRPTGTAAATAPGELEGAGEQVPAGRAGTRVQRHHGRATGTVTDAQDAQRELDRLPVAKAAGIGLGQALALIPGTSRSGVTISVGLFEGVSREAAARFSFLLSIPAILGAGILKLDELSRATETPAELAAGTIAAAVSGFLAVSFLIRLLRTRTLWPFIWYRLLAGGLFVLLLSTVRS